MQLKNITPVDILTMTLNKWKILSVSRRAIFTISFLIRLLFIFTYSAQASPYWSMYPFFSFTILTLLLSVIKITVWKFQFKKAFLFDYHIKVCMKLIHSTNTPWWMKYHFFFGIYHHLGKFVHNIRDPDDRWIIYIDYEVDFILLITAGCL